MGRCKYAPRPSQVIFIHTGIEYIKPYRWKIDEVNHVYCECKATLSHFGYVVMHLTSDRFIDSPFYPHFVLSSQETRKAIERGAVVTNWRECRDWRKAQRKKLRQTVINYG